MAPIRFGLILMPTFSQLGLYSVTEPMRAANSFRPLSMEWQLLSQDGCPVQASSGDFVNVAGSLETAGDFDYVALFCGDDPLSQMHPDYGRYLRRCRLRGSRIGAFDVAQFLMAEMGFLDHKRATVHWEYGDAFRERYTRVDVQTTLFERQGDIFTCAGGTAGLDFILELVGENFGGDLARQIASRFLIKEFRTSEERQALDVKHRYGTHDVRLISALHLMESHLEDPLSIAEIARRADTSQRTLERAFHRLFGMAPATHYLRLRLIRAQRLLQQSDMPITEIAVICGFASLTQFGRTYRKHMSETPSAARAAAHV